MQKPGESARNERETPTSERESLARGIGAQAREEDFQVTQNAGKLPAREESEDKALGSERGPSQSTETEGRPLGTQGWKGNWTFQGIEDFKTVHRLEAELRAREGNVQARERRIWGTEITTREREIKKMEKQQRKDQENLRKGELEVGEKELKTSGKRRGRQAQGKRSSKER